MDEFQIPEDVTQVEDLEASVEAALAAADAILDEEDPTDEQLARARQLAEFVRAARAEATRREEEAVGREEELAALRRELHGEEDSEETPEGEGEPEAEPDPDADEDDGPEGAAEREPEAVAAGGVVRRRAPSLVRRTRQPDNPTPAATSSTLTMTAAAGIRGVEAGGRIPDLDALTAAFMQRIKSFPKGNVPGQYLRQPVATMSRGGWGELDQNDRTVYEDDQHLIAAAGDEKRKTITDRGGLTAAGWCAPSETLYDFLTPFTTDGLLDIGEFRVTRGGVNTTLGPDFAALWADATSGFAQTEAQAEVATPKPCIDVDCPPFAETRLDAIGYCVTAGILQETAYPELVRDFVAGVAVGHQHKRSNRTIASIASQIGTAVTVAATGSAARSVLTALELASEGQRQRYRLSENETLEVIAPRWLRIALRDDLANRNGVGLERVTNAVLDGHLADRGVRVQWVLGWQQLPGGACTIAFPDAANLLMYPAGTFVRGVEDVLNLDAVYDTTQLTTNTYTAAFFEEAMLVLRRGYGGCNLRIPLAMTGATGPQNLPAYPTTVAAP